MRVRLHLAILLLAACLVGGCGGDDSADSPPPPDTAATSPEERPAGETAPEHEHPEGEQEGHEHAEDESGDPAPHPPADPARRRAAAAAVRAYRAYIAAINDRDGATLCGLLTPDALRALRPPVRKGSCTHRIGASIGYRDPRGFPVWEHTELTAVDAASVSGDLMTARLGASVVTSFADREEPSIETDVAYLQRAGDRWQLAKPTPALYRAVGRPELPPSVISPP